MTFNDVDGQEKLEVLKGVLVSRPDARIRDIKTGDRFLFVKDPDQQIYIAVKDAYNSNLSGEADPRGQYWSVDVVKA